MSSISRETRTTQLKTLKYGSGTFYHLISIQSDRNLNGRNFKKECPNGILDKGKVMKIYEQKLIPNEDSKFLVDQLFRIIDDDNNGGIDFKVVKRG